MKVVRLVKEMYVEGKRRKRERKIEKDVLDVMESDMRRVGINEDDIVELVKVEK